MEPAGPRETFGPPPQEEGRDPRFYRRRRIEARRSGWAGGTPARHGADDRPRDGFHRCAPWGRSRRFDHTHPWHRRDWLRRIVEEPTGD